MTPQDLAVIEARAEAATPGPWRETGQRDHFGYLMFGNRGTWLGHVYAQDEHVADARFVAHAREDVPALCRALRESWRTVGLYEIAEENGRLRAALSRVEERTRGFEDKGGVLDDVVSDVRAVTLAALEGKP